MTLWYVNQVPMKQINIETLLENMTYYVQEAKNGAIFVYPTDTIYGLWGIVTPKVVDRIDKIKQRLPGKHYSIIAPNITRIQKYMDVSDDFGAERDALKAHYGPLTLLLTPKKDIENTPNRSLLSPSDLIWVRLIDHPIQQFVSALWQPYITTSANISWLPQIQHLSDLTDDQIAVIDYAIDDGILDGAGSTILVYQSWEIIRLSK